MMKANDQKRIDFLLIAAPAALTSVIIIRLIAIFSGRAMPDADECIVGLMARHVLTGEHPIYFYGQSYGAGAGLEAHLLAAVFYLFGFSTKALKLVGLMFWLVLAGISFLLAKNIFGKRTALFSLIILSVAPQMAEWGMKLRGGHLPALIFLMLAAAVVWPLLKPDSGDIAKRKVWILSFFTGFLSALALWLQPVAMFAIPVIGIAHSIWKKRISSVIALALGAAAVFILYFSIILPPAIWQPDFGAGSGLASLVRFFTPYFDQVHFPLRIDEYIIAGIFGVSFILAFSWSIAKIYQARIEGLVFIDLIIILTILSAAIIVRSSLEPRHLIALYPFCCLLIGAGLDALSSRSRNAGHVMVMLLFMSGLWINAGTMLSGTFHNPYDGHEMSISALHDTIQSLGERKIRYVLCADAEYKWNLIFNSGERVIARSYNPNDRYPAYVNEVNDAVRRGLPVAVVIPRPDYPKRQPLVQGILKSPGAQAVRVADVLIITGVPGPALLHFFPERLEPR